MAARNNTIAAGMLKPSIMPSFFFSSLARLSPVVVFAELLEEEVFSVVGEGVGGVETFVEGSLSKRKEIFVSLQSMDEER